MAVLTIPAAKPLVIAIKDASSNATLRVRLLSIAQKRHAASTASDGNNEPKRMSSGHERTSAPATMSAMPNAIRRSKFSRKTNQAMSAVSTPSALSNSEAPDAGTLTSPHMSKAGAIIPPAITAPASHPASALPTRVASARLKRRHVASPMPEPR